MSIVRLEAIHPTFAKNKDAESITEALTRIDEAFDAGQIDLEAADECKNEIESNGANKIIEVDFDDDGHCAGTNKHNWCNLIELTGEPGNWSASWKAEVSEMMSTRYNIGEIIG